jgi:hypothetical protein
MDVEDAQSSRRTSGRFGCRVAMLRPYKKELKVAGAQRWGPNLEGALEDRW